MTEHTYASLTTYCERVIEKQGLDRGTARFNHTTTDHDEATEFQRLTGGNVTVGFDPFASNGAGRAYVIRFFYRDLPKPAFINRHDITEEEFETNHYQTLFRIEHPEASL